MHDGYPKDIDKRISEFFVRMTKKLIGNKNKNGARIWAIIMTAITRVLC